MNRTPQERSEQGRIGALTSWAFTDDRVARTAAARQAANDRFERLVDPEGKLPPEERAKRAAFLRSAHMRKLALLSAAARKKKAA